MRYLIAVIIFYYLLLLTLVYSFDGETGEPFHDWRFTPEIEFKAVDTSYTGWNKFWLVAAIVGQAADVASTSYAINHGAEEVNPVYGKDPNLLLMVGIKMALIGGGCG